MGAKKLQNKIVDARRLMDFSPDDLRKRLKSNLTINFSDGQLNLNAHEVILNRYMWESVRKYIVDFNMPLRIDHSITQHYVNGYYVSDSLNKALEQIIKDIISFYFEPNNNSEGIEEIWQSFQELFNTVYNDIIFNNIKYVPSLNINDLLDIQLEPELVQKMREVNELDITTDNIVMGRTINAAHNTLDTILKERPDNKVAKGYISGNFNPKQVVQVLSSRGNISTLTNEIYAKPIGSSFCSGMYAINEIAQEAATAARSLMLSSKAVAKAEYFARTMQLVTMVVEKLVPGDCCAGPDGKTDYSKVQYEDWYVKPASKEGAYIQTPDLPNLVGKYYFNPETGREEEIKKTDKHLEGTTIKLRVAYNCKHKDPKCICARCFGKLYYNIPKHTNIGHFSSTCITQLISQLTLSDKHHTASAKSLLIYINKEAANDFYTKEDDNNNVYLKQKVENVNLDGSKELLYNNKKDFDLKFKVYKTSVNGIGDIKEDTDVRAFVVTSVSILRDLYLVKTDLKTGEVTEIPVDISKGTYEGSFTIEFLEHIQEYGYTLGEDDYYYIDINEWKHSNPIITVNDVSFNYLMLVNTIKKIFGGKNREKDSDSSLEIRSPKGLLEKLFNEINNKLSINIALIEVIVYAFSCYDYDNGDYRLGRNSPNMTTRSITDILTHTSLGAGYAWETHKRLMLNSYAFNMKNCREHPLDVTICPQEVINRYS